MRSTSIRLKGVVCGIAHGTARARNEKIAGLLFRSLPVIRGFDLGTLNIQVTFPPALKIKRLTSPVKTVVLIPKTKYAWRKRPLKAEKITFLPVVFSIAGKVPERKGFLYLASRSSRPRRGVLELMSRENLKGTYGVGDGDEVAITILNEESP